MSAAVVLSLTRHPDDKKRLCLEGFGDFRAKGKFRAWATITAVDGRVWKARRATWTNRAIATDESGAEVARYQPVGMLEKGNGGTLTVGGTTSYVLRSLGGWALLRGDEQLASFVNHKRGTGKVDVTVTGDVDPLVLLMICWTVRERALDAAKTV